MCSACGNARPVADHQRRAGEQQGAHVVARRDEADRQRHQRGAQQRGRGHDPDLNRLMPIADR